MKKVFCKGSGFKGSITVFIALIMLFVLAVVTTVLEMTRITSVYTRAAEISDICLDSCFAAYAKEVFEDYGIMLLWRNDEEFINTYMRYVDKNCSSEDILLNYSDIYGLKVVDTIEQERINALENCGEYIAEQIYQYMRLAVTEDIASELLGKCTSLSQGEDVNEFYEKLEGCSDAMEQMEQNVADIYENIADIQEIEYLPSDILNNMKSDLENIMNTVGDDDYSKAVRDNLFEIYKHDFRKYVRWEETTTTALDNILNETDNYLRNVDNTKEYVESMKKELESKKASLDRELYELMEREIHDINEEMINQDKDIYNVMDNYKKSVVQKEIADNVKNGMSSIMEETRQLDYSYNKLSNYENGEQLIQNTYQCVCKALEGIEGYDCSILKVHYTKAQGQKKKNEILDFVKKIKEDGVLGYIADGTVSKKKIDIEHSPSKSVSGYQNVQWKKSGTTEEVLKKVLIGQYVFDKFHSFVNCDGASPLDYEVEYIIEGKKSDKENLEKVVDKIIIIREGFNLIYLAKDSAKRNEAYEAALAITGFTGMPVVIRVTQFLILGAWAYAESVVDVKDLLAGYRVKLMKGEDDWNLSLSGIKNLNATDEDREKRGGLSYQDYLRVMLFTQNQSEQVLRIMDVVELNVQKKYNSAFKIEDCLVGISLCTEYEVKRVFSMIGYSKDYILYKDDRFIIKIKQSFRY